MANQKIIYKELELIEIKAHLLQQFNRYQETKKVWYEEHKQYKLKEDYFTEQWDDERKRQVIDSIRSCKLRDGIVIGAFIKDQLKGFACVEGGFLGSQKQYLELSYIHVSRELRNSGIGKELFMLCCKHAKKKGAKKLYIGAHPSVETQQFYRSLGCTYAVEINKEIYEREPLDIQLEYLL
ncbi:GNAT family N-acetyltransferase [Bacillus timonensis]|nr:GNAT family N-acetyltransferase [Bacillus timonensis]